MACFGTFRLSGLAILIAAQAIAGTARAADVLTQHYDNARTGAVLDEKVLNTTSVNPTNFGKLWTLYADGQVVAQPLYVSNLAIDTSPNTNAPLVRGRFNAVIIATMHNTVYVYDADKENRGADGRTIPLWATWLGKPRPGGKDIDMWSTNDPEWGILGTPVVSDDRKTLFVVAWHDDGPRGLRYRLHALDLASGVDRQQTDIGPSSVDPSQPCRKQSAFNPCLHKQRSALLLSNGIIYVGFGGDGNRGAVFAFDARTLQQQGQFWSSTPTGFDGGIWQSGQGPAADQQGNIYLITGNGTFDGVSNFGNSAVKLRREAQGLAVKDYFTPCNVRFLNDKDLDFGSAGPVLLPENPPRIIAGGKEGVLYVLARDGMGKHVPGPTGGAEDCPNPNLVQQVRAFEIVEHGGAKHWGNIHGSPVYWRGPDTARIYVWGENSPLKAYKFAQGRLQDVDKPKQSAFRPPLGMPGGMLALSADRNKAGSGILWAVVPLDGDANRQRGVKGIVLALDAQDVSRTLWTSEQVPSRDRLGLFAKFNPPLVANGKLFVPTYGDDEPLQVYGQGPDRHPARFPRNYYVAVYGPNPPAHGSRRVVNQARDDITVLRVELEPLVLDTARCAPVDAGTVDCTDALAQAGQAPSFHHIVFSANQAPSGSAILILAFWT